MTGMPLALPDGRRGQALAAAITLAGALVIWFAAAAPLLDWYQAGAAQLAQQQLLAARLHALARDIPALRQAASATGTSASGGEFLLAGGSDEIAGANLQSALQTMAAQAGTSLDSAELLAAQQNGLLRRISVQVSLTATWPDLINLLALIAQNRPRLVVDTLSLTAADQDAGQGAGQTQVQASFTVSGFSAGTP